jgi:predicted lipoprotein with Yx(FWY)xxD motif
VRKSSLMTTLVAGTLTLAACATGGSGTGGTNAGGGSTTAGASSTSTSASTSAPSTPALGTATTALGAVVVDSRGMTVYEFDEDTVGSATTACTGQCADFWPAVTTTSATPVVTGVTGTVGTVAGDAGVRQVTLEGHRLYTFVKDTEPGDVVGQGFGNAWWVLSPAGQPITAPSPAPTS